MKKRGARKDKGFVLLGVLILLSLALLITSGMLDSAATNSKTRALVNTQSAYYYEVEETMNRVVAWLQENSKNMVKAFDKDHFPNNFQLSASPTLGSNEGEHFGVPTLVKLKSDISKSAMLSNNDFFGVPAFPESQNIDTGASFDAIQAFRDANIGPANARILLVWARETDGHFEPIFRVDVVTGNNPDRGVHSFSYIYSHLVMTAADLGFYGRDWVTFNTPNNDCFSYLYTLSGSTWSKGAPRSNCPVGSNGPINISSDINGTAKTLLSEGINLLPPGGNVSGSTCEGPGCHSYTLPVFGDWDSYCAAANNGDLRVSADTTLDEGGCWRDVGIDNKKTLYLTDTENPYYFRMLDFRANFAKFSPGAVPQGKEVTIYVETISNNAINGNQFYNAASAPHQLKINYIGTAPLKLNGTAALNAFLVAPKVQVTVNGNFNYYGGIKAMSLLFSGNCRPNYDESGTAVPALQDMTFSLKKASQRYR